LHGLAEAHVIREQRAESRATQEDEPIDAFSLVGAQDIFERGVDRSAGDPVEAFDEGSQAFEGGWRRLVEIFTEQGEVGQGVASDASARVAGSEQIGNAIPIETQPVLRELGEAAAFELYDGLALGPSTQN
jgi:hypothetical protein